MASSSSGFYGKKHESLLQEKAQMYLRNCHEQRVIQLELERQLHHLQQENLEQGQRIDLIFLKNIPLLPRRNC